MALAQLADVKRVGRVEGADAARDEQLLASLQAAESWVIKRLKADYAASDPTTAKYYDVHENALLELPLPVSSVSAVRVSYSAASAGSTLDASSGYDVQNGRYVRLRPSLYTAPFEGATAQRLPGIYVRVEIDYTPTGVVPPAVRDGVATLAYGLWRTSPAFAGGLASETLGDYSYTLDKGESGVPGYYDAAMSLLRPFMLKRKVMVT